MKKIIVIIIWVLIAQFSFGQQFTDLKGDFLRQIPPGDTAVIFARGIASTNDKERWAPRLSPDGSEVFWWSIRLDDNKMTNTKKRNCK